MTWTPRSKPHRSCVPFDCFQASLERQRLGYSRSHGSELTNLNCRRLEDDKDFELVVLIDDPAFARVVLWRVCDVDRTHSRRISEADLHEGMAGLRRRVRDPRTMLLLERRML